MTSKEEILKRVISINIDAYALHSLELGHEYADGRIDAYKHVLDMIKMIEDGVYDSHLGR